MTTQLQQWLGDRDGAREFYRWFDTIMRGGDHQEIDAFLTKEMLAHPHPIGSLCLARPLSTVCITGWDELAADLASEEERHSDKGPITAVGVELSAHCEPDDDAWALEVSVYDDEAYPFGKGDIAAINAEAAGTSTEWRGCFRDISNSLTIVGLGRIYSAIEDNNVGAIRRGVPASVDQVADCLGHCFATLRFHQALIRDAARHGLPRAMVLLGGAHDVSPYYEAAYWCETVREDKGKAAAILAARDVAYKARFKAQTEQMIADWRARRKVIVRRQLRANNRQEVADYSASHDKVFYQMTGLGDGRPSHELSDHEFERLLYAWRRQRAAKMGDDPDAIAIPEMKRSGIFGFFRRTS